MMQKGKELQKKKTPNLTGTGVPSVECCWAPSSFPRSWDKNYSLLSKHTTIGQHRDTAQGCAGWLDRTDWSKAGLSVSEIQTIQLWITERSITAFTLKRHREMRVWPPPRQHQQRLANEPGAPMLPRTTLDHGSLVGRGQSTNSKWLSFALQANASSAHFTHQHLHRPSEKLLRCRVIIKGTMAESNLWETENWPRSGAVTSSHLLALLQSDA